MAAHVAHAPFFSRHCCFFTHFSSPGAGFDTNLDSIGPDPIDTTILYIFGREVSYSCVSTKIVVPDSSSPSQVCYEVVSELDVWGAQSW